jgi:hypothetical protein
VSQASGHRGFRSGIRRQNLFSLVNGVLSELKDDGRKAIYVTQQGRELCKRMLSPDPDPILYAPRGRQTHRATRCSTPSPPHRGSRLKDLDPQVLTIAF